MIYFVNKANSKKLMSKHQKGLIIKIYRGIYVDKISDIARGIELILEYLGIRGVLFYKSAIEYPKNITENRLYIVSETINKKIILGNNDFRIEVFKLSKKSFINHRELTKTYSPHIYQPKPIYGFLLNFVKSNIYAKRANKNLACELIIREVLDSFKSIEYRDIYLNSIKNYANSIDMSVEYEQLRVYFDNYFQENYQNYDKERIELFLLLKESLEYSSFEVFPKADRNILFYEAYFSNYIEGTEFEIGEAENIIFDAKHRYERHRDGHDIKNTYKILTEIYDKPMIFSSYEDFVSSLKQIHIKLMGHREDEILVGEFKQKVNLSGSMKFVLPSQLNMTLQKAYQIYDSLKHPIHRAIFIHLMISEIHPFDDGNGRISRIFMNNELSRANYAHILIPTVFRDDYITALKGFSHQRNPKPIIKALIKAYRITNSVNWNNNRAEINSYIYKNSGFEKDTNGIWGVFPSSNVSLGIGEFADRF